MPAQAGIQPMKLHSFDETTYTVQQNDALLNRLVSAFARMANNCLHKKLLCDSGA